MKLAKRTNVLYVEDNEDSGFMLSTLLSFSEIDVSLVRSVEAAFQSALNKHFDLYLIDTKFPKSNGFLLCKQLRDLSPQTPIVFYSGEAYQSDKDKGMSAGANAYLVKPNVDTVAPTIFNLLENNPKI